MIDLELNRKTVRNILLLVLSVAVIWWGISHIALVVGALQAILSILSPMLIGLALAFVLNLLLCPLERGWSRIFKGDSRLSRRLRRPVCLLLSLLIVLGVIFAVCFVVIPRVGSTVADMVGTISAYFRKLDIRYDHLRAMMEQLSLIHI